MRTFLPLMCGVLAAAPLPARAEADLQAWTLLTLQGHMTSRSRLYAELQPRVALVPDAHLDRLLVRAALGWDLGREITVWLGYAWTPTFPAGFVDEKRPFQQLTIGTRGAAGAMQNRTRIEQRFIEGSDLSLRLRHMLRVQRPVEAGSRWLLVAYDELFVNLNDATGGPSAGFDQNRTYVGAGRVIDRVTLEAGYMLDAVARPSPRTWLLRSNLVLGVAIVLP